MIRQCDKGTIQTIFPGVSQRCFASLNSDVNYNLPLRQGLKRKGSLPRNEAYLAINLVCNDTDGKHLSTFCQPPFLSLGGVMLFFSSPPTPSPFTDYSFSTSTIQMGIINFSVQKKWSSSLLRKRTWHNSSPRLGVFKALSSCVSSEKLFISLSFLTRCSFLMFRFKNFFIELFFLT